ncbi:MAG: hypothetical protein QM645_14185 [Asticcacaulis sp.]
MTKARPPLTVYRALSRIADLIGWDGCASVCDKTEWTMRKYADPDAEREISMRDAIRLDLAYRRAGGEGAPLFQAYALRLDIENWRNDRGCFIGLAREAARESGEAIDALLGLSTGGNPKAALKEAEEAHAAFGKTIAALKRKTRDNRAHD